MNKKIWQGMGVCLLAGFLTVQTQAEGKPDVDSKVKAGQAKAESDVKSAVDAIDSGQFTVVSVTKAAKEGWYNVVMLLPNGKEVTVSVNGNSSLVAGYVEEPEGETPTEPTEPVEPVEPTEPVDPIDSGDSGLVDGLNPFGL